MDPKPTRAEQEDRRRTALRKVAEGRSAADVADFLGVHVETVRRPTEFGFRTNLGTAARVAQLIRDRFGVAYHPGYLREWLTERRHTPQKPARRANQRDPVAHDRWLKGDYPALQKKSPPRTPISS